MTYPQTSNLILISLQVLLIGIIIVVFFQYTAVRVKDIPREFDLCFLGALDCLLFCIVSQK